MKTLKLEVGKTYRNRKGEEVKIVSKDNTDNLPYQGSGGNWYAESGKWSSYATKNPEDLIEEVETTRHTFAIPDGVKKVTVEQVGNRIVVEMVPESGVPKPGDVMINKQGIVYILKEAVDNNAHKYYARLGGSSGRLSVIGRLCPPGRPATPEEAQPLFDALKKAGKRWNAETMEVEEVPERERIMEYLKGYAIDATWIRWLAEGYLKYREGEK